MLGTQMNDRPKMVTIRFKPGGSSGMIWGEGENVKHYGPGGEEAGYNGGDTVTCSLSAAYTQVMSGRAEVVNPENPADPFGLTTPPDAIDNRDPGPRRRR